MRLIISLGRSIPAFLKDECSYLAASISFFSILAVVPLGLLIIALFAYFMGENQDLYRFILSGLTSLFPTVTEGITAELKKVIIYRGISLVMVVAYCLVSLQLFYSIERAMNIIFKVPKKRHFLLSILWSILVVTILIVFLLFSFTASSMVKLLEGHAMTVIGFEIGVGLGILFKYITPFILVVVTFTTVYLVVPRGRVSLLNAFTGALFVAIMWELAKLFFTWYVRQAVYIGAIYGSLTTFILFLLWVYYASSIFLLGAEFVSNLEGRS